MHISFFCQCVSPILDKQGQLIGIHGRSITPYADTAGLLSIPGGANFRNTKVGLSLAIPINTYLNLLQNPRTSTGNRTINSSIGFNPTTADDYLIQAIMDAAKAKTIEQFGKSLATIDEAIKLRPNYGAAFFAKGILQEGIGNFTGALQNLNRGLSLTAGNEMIFMTRAGIRSHLRDKLGAIEDYSQILRMNPSFFDAYWFRATTRYELGELRGALEDSNQALLIDPDHVPVLWMRSNLLLALGSQRESKNDLQKVVELCKQEEISRGLYNDTACNAAESMLMIQQQFPNAF